MIIVLNKRLIDCLNNHCTKVVRIFPDQREHQKQLIRANRPLTMMALFESILSMLPRITLAIATVYYIISPDYISNTLLAVADILIFFSAAGSFFVFYNFNLKFRNKYLELIRQPFNFR